MPDSYHRSGRSSGRLHDAGRVTDGTCWRAKRQLALDPVFRPTMHQCVEARGVTELSIAAAGVREVARANVFAPGSRRAIIAGNATFYGYGRMFQIFRHTTGEVIQMFWTVEDTHRWLGLE